MEVEADQLQQAVECQYHCAARLAQSVPVKEMRKGATVWEGVVDVFDPKGHLTAVRAFAGSSSPIEGSDKRRFFAVLHQSPVDSPRVAVRAAIVAEHRMADLEAQFTEAMFDIYRRAKSEASYPANIFLQIVTDKGGRATAKTLINAPRPSDGYTALYLRKRLDLTVEALVLENPRWHSLFTPEEIERARRRLTEYRYEPKAMLTRN